MFKTELYTFEMFTFQQKEDNHIHNVNELLLNTYVFFELAKIVKWPRTNDLQYTTYMYIQA